MDYQKSLDFIMLILLASIIISIIFAWFSIQIAPRIGLMDIPGSAKHKNHQKPIPLTGGIVLLDTLLLIILFTGFWKNSEVLAICFSTLIVGVMGIVDDFFNLKPIIKFIGQLMASIVLIYFGVKGNSCFKAVSILINFCFAQIWNIFLMCYNAIYLLIQLINY